MRHNKAQCRKNFEGKNLPVPSEPKAFIKALQINWATLPDRPPDTEPAALLEYLIELGISTKRPNGRIDVGDLYLRGFHLKRKGGVARPQKVGELS